MIARLLLIAAWFGCLPSSAGAERLTAERVYSDPAISGPMARAARISPDGRAVSFIRARADDQTLTDLWLSPVEGGPARRLIDAAQIIAATTSTVSEEELSRRERSGVSTRGVIEYEWDPTGEAILVPVEGDLYLFDIARSALRRLTSTPSTEIDARVSPRGTYVSFVRDHNLVLMALGSGRERQITSGGGPDAYWGLAEFIAQEEMGRSRGYWWSPDESRIAVAYVDERGVDIVPRTDVNAGGSTVVQQRYPRVGRPNARVGLHIAQVSSGRMTAVDLGPETDIYLARADWSRDGRTLYVQRQSRDQKTLDLLAVDPASGRSRVILTETSPHWVELTDDFQPLRNGTFLWSSERSGTRQIYLYQSDGKLVRQVTSGSTPVDTVIGVDEEARLVYFTAGYDTPLEQRIYSISYGRPLTARPVTSAGGWWSGEMRGDALLATYEDPSTPPRTGVFTSAGELVSWVEENRLDSGHPYYPHMARHQTPRFGEIQAADGQTLHWMIRTPADFDPSRRYPAIVQVYGGPAAALVQRRWLAPSDQLWLEAGFILFSIDNRGTPNRDVRFKTAIHRRMGQIEVEDQLAGIRHLAALPFVDPTRIGVTGYSNGGYMSLLLLTASDTPVTAGAAGAPVSDWRLYDTHYTERYMETQDANEAGYRAADALGRIGAVKPGSLLIYHGMADDNVTLDQSTRLIAALQERGVSFDMMLYPGLRHRGGWSPVALRHRHETVLNFFSERLKAETER